MSESSASSVQNSDFEDILSEMKERENKSRNIIFFNLDEASSSLSPASSWDASFDTDSVKEILTQIQPAVLSELNVTRLGRKIPNKHRPVRVTLSSRSDVLSVLRNKRNYTGPVSIREDLTLRQRNHLRDVRAELNKLIDAGVFDKTIRYVNGSIQKN